MSFCFVCCVFAKCLVKQFAMCFGVVAILLLNVMDVFSVCGCALLDSSIECVWCACDPNERLSAPSICFVCVCVCRKLSPHLGVCELDHRYLLSLCYFFA